MADDRWDSTKTWHEFMASRPEKIREFYEEVVGLTLEFLEGAPFPYTVWMQDEAPVEDDPFSDGDGQGNLPPGLRPHRVTSFATADLDEAVKKAEALGGQVLVPPVDIPRFGRAAVLKDPEGTVFGIFQGIGKQVP